MSFLKKKKAEENPADQPIELDFLIHNMPVSEDKAPAKAASRPRSAQTGGSYKKVGLVIILVGAALIMVLAYFGYQMIFNSDSASEQVKPEDSGSQAVQEQTTDNEQVTVPDDEDAISATSTPDGSINNQTASSSDNIASSSDGITVEIATSTINIIDDIASSSVSISVGEDSDGDGLSDISESALGTSQYLADSDSDSYADLAEISNGYNPAGPGKIGESGVLGYYLNDTYSYRVMYPKAWGQKNIGGDYFSIFSVPDGSLIQISVQDNTRKQDIISWYRQEFSFFDTFDQNRLIRTDGNNQGIYSADGMTVYLTDEANKNIYILSFVPVSEGQVDYFQLFQLMIQSLQVDYSSNADIAA